MATSSFDPTLVSLLEAFVREPRLPWVDRWFSLRSKTLRFSADQRKALWVELARCLRCAFGFYRSVTGSKYDGTTWGELGSWLCGKERRWASFQSSEQVFDTEYAGIPPWLESSWNRRVQTSKWFSHDAETFCRRQAEPPLVYLRFSSNPKGDRASDELRSIATRWVESKDGCVEFASARSVFETAAWKTGGFEVQDASSQDVVRRADVRPGMRVWDVCAGRGGKTLATANQMRQKGIVVATDLYASKLNELRRRSNRSDAFNVRTLVWDGKCLPDFGIELGSGGGFDRVILDAPCSATGTWRRDPEARFRIEPHGLSALVEVQRNLVELAYSSLKSGGRFVYSTCSWLVEENEAIVDDFVASHNARWIDRALIGAPISNANTMFVAIWEKP